MTDYYIDTDGGTDGGGNALSWSAADKTLKYSLENRPAAGDRIFMQGAAKDTSAASVTITTIAGTDDDPVFVIGCIDGTTNEPPVGSDYSDKDSANNPEFEVTGATSDFTLAGSDVTHIRGVDITIGRSYTMSSDTWLHCEDLVFTHDVSTSDGLYINNNPASLTFKNCDVNAYYVYPVNRGGLNFVGGSLTTTASFVIAQQGRDTKLWGVELDGTSSHLVQGYGMDGCVRAFHCKFPTSFGLASFNPIQAASAAARNTTYVEAIGCSDNTTTKATTSSFQDYEYEDPYGSVLNEATVVRTGGADDGATGGHSLAMTPIANQTYEGSGEAVLYTPWMAVWVEGGARTLTVYTTHDNAGTINRDLYENELSVEFWYPDNGDTAQHTYDPEAGLERHDPNSTSAAGTDDTTSTWATYNTYKRSFAISVTPGYSGWAYARARMAYASATPVTAYIDPKIVVS